MTKKQKRILLRIIVTAVIFIGLIIATHTGVFDNLQFRFIELVLYLIPYFIISYDIIIKAFKNIIRGQIFDENFLMLTATVAAFCIKEFPEAVAVMLFYQVGELFQSYAVGKSRKSISDMMDIMPEYANVEHGGELTEVSPDDVCVGSIIVIKPGEKIPLDGIVEDGTSFIDTMPLTGEAVPRRVKKGDQVISGCINGSDTLKVRVTKEFEDSTVTRILELVENASSKKAKAENFITRFAKIYTPFVTVCAVILAFLPPLILGGGFAEWIRRACIFLVISCPCALVISVPLGFFGGIGASSKIGVLIKGGNYLEALAQINTLVFDKTGTLTKGEFKVSEVIPTSVSTEELLRLAALSEGYSNHPIASSVRDAYNKPLAMESVTSHTETAGFGVHSVIDGHNVYVGNAKLLVQNGITFKESNRSGTVIYVASDGVFLGTIVIRDAVKDGVKEAFDKIKNEGVKKFVMLTGDREDEAQAVAQSLKIDEVHSELLPDDKLHIVERLLTSLSDKEKLAFVGDGINDAPVLSRSDIGIAMGSMGSDAAIEAADIVIMDDDIMKIASTVKISKKVMRIVKENIFFALTVKALIMILGVFGIANMWIAVFADVGVAIIAILNSMRTLKIKR